MEIANPSCPLGPNGPNAGVVVKEEKPGLGLLPKDLLGKLKI